LTFPVILAAKSLFIPIFILEQNILPGRVNRYLAFLATKIFISFQESLQYFPKNKTYLKGNPVRKYFLEDNYYTELKKLEPELISYNQPIILIFGGSQGAYVINNFFLQNYSELKTKPYIFIHITGEKFYSENFKNNINILKNNTDQIKVITLPYFEKMDYLYQLCQGVICRAGATTIAELLHFNKPSILIPYPYAKDNHQFYNAKYLADRNQGIILLEKELTLANIYSKIKNILELKFNAIPINARRSIAEIILS